MKLYMSPNQDKGSIDDRISAYHDTPAQAEEVKQPEAKPASEQKPTEVVTPSPVREEPKVQPEPSEEEALANSKNPERTKAYIDKLKSQLKEKTTAEAQASEESVFDVFHPEKQVENGPVTAAQEQQFPQVQAPYLNPLQVQNLQQQFVKPDGTVDIEGFNQAIRQANLSAYQATLRTQNLEQKMARFEQRAEEQQAYAQHPEIDPQHKESFDKNLFGLVRDRLLRNMFQGKHEALLKVTNDIKKEIGYQTKVADVKREAVQEYKENQRARNQGPFEAGRGGQVSDTTSLEDLRKASRQRGTRGDAAIGERLKRLGI